MDAIRYYVQGAFQGVKLTPEVLEQQEELIADLTAKVGDLVAEGKTQEEALGVAIASVGDLSTLVSEFESVDETAERVPVATVYANRLDLHTLTISTSIGAAVMIASTALGAWTDLVHPGAGFSLLAVLAAGIWWVRGAYLRHLAEPGHVQLREVAYKRPFRAALLVWAGVVAGSIVLNAVSGTDFWSWPFWVAGGTWALAVKVEERLVARGLFEAPAPEAS